MDEKSPKVLAVLDWELSTLGDPLSDLAYNCLAYYLTPQFPIMPGIAGIDLQALGIPTDVEYMKDYCKAVGIPPVKDWNYYLAFSFFRIAAILQGVYARAMKGKRLFKVIRFERTNEPTNQRTNEPTNE